MYKESRLKPLCLFDHNKYCPCLPPKSEKKIFFSHDFKLHSSSFGETVIEALKEASRQSGFSLITSPKDIEISIESGIGTFCHNTCSKIINSSAIIADLSCWWCLDAPNRKCGIKKECNFKKHVTNPNVSFEIMLALAHKKEIIPIIKEEQRLRQFSDFNVIDWEIIRYSNKASSFRALRDEISKRIAKSDKINLYPNENVLKNVNAIQEALLYFEERLSEGESTYVINKKIPTISFSNSLKSIIKKQLQSQLQPTGSNEYIALINKRSEAFKKNIKKNIYYKMILCDNCIRRFFENQKFDSEEIKNAWLDTLDNLLKQTQEYKNYQIRISYEPLFVYFTLFKEEFFYFLERPEDIHSNSCIYSSDKENVENQIKQFEFYWDRLKSRRSSMDISSWVTKTKRLIEDIPIKR